MNISQKIRRIRGKDDVEEIVFNIPILKYIFIFLFSVIFIKPFYQILEPAIDKTTTYIKFKIVHAKPPGIVKHSYLSGEYMRTMEDLLSESIEYRKGNAGNDEFLDMEFYNSRSHLLNSLGYLDYQSPLLTEIMSSRIDKLPEIIQTNTFDQVNSHLKGFLEKNDKHLTSLYMAAYYLEAYTSNLMLHENLPDSPHLVDISSTETWLQLAKGYYIKAQKNLKYWLPNLHLTECNKVSSADMLRDDQNRLKEYLGDTEDFDDILKYESPKTWLKPIECENY